MLLLLTMLLLTGSGRGSKGGVTPSEAETAAVQMAESLPRGDREMWRDAARKRPLWLLQVSSF